MTKHEKKYTGIWQRRKSPTDMTKEAHNSYVIWLIPRSDTAWVTFQNCLVASFKRSTEPIFWLTAHICMWHYSFLCNMTHSYEWRRMTHIECCLAANDVAGGATPCTRTLTFFGSTGLSRKNAFPPKTILSKSSSAPLCTREFDFQKVKESLLTSNERYSRRINTIDVK